MHLTTHDLLVPNDAAQHFPSRSTRSAGPESLQRAVRHLCAANILILGAVIGAVVLAVTVIFELAATHPQGGAWRGFLPDYRGLDRAGPVVLLAGRLRPRLIRSQWR